MLDHIYLKNLLFIDIETVPEIYHYEELSETRKELWQEKVKYQTKGATTAKALYAERAGIFSEFAKIVCISIGFLVSEKKETKLRVKSFFGKEEKQVLQEFTQLIKKQFSDLSSFCFCGHNIKEFDLPFICRRLIINGLDIPDSLNFAGLKPWEVTHIDTLELWKFGDRKNFTSLKLLCEVLKIPSSKNDISGKDVAKVFYEENDLERIKKYCERDVWCVANLILKLKAKPLLKETEIIVVN